MSDDRAIAEARESVLVAVLEQLGDVDDADTVRTGLVLQAALDEVLSFKRPRAAVVAGLRAAIDAEITAGELRARTRSALRDLADGTWDA